MTDTPLEQAKQHSEQAQKHAGEARAKLETVEREADELAEAYPNGLPAMIADSLTDRWQTTIAAAQTHATLALGERVAAVAGLLEGLATPRAAVAGTDDLSGSWVPAGIDEWVEWQWWDASLAGMGEWLAAHSEADADTLAGSHGRVRSHVVGAWHERPAR